MLAATTDIGFYRALLTTFMPADSFASFSETTGRF
jgi:hypothetical protein